MLDFEGKTKRGTKSHHCISRRLAQREDDVETPYEEKNAHRPYRQPDFAVLLSLLILLNVEILGMTGKIRSAGFTSQHFRRDRTVVYFDLERIDLFVEPEDAERAFRGEWLISTSGKSDYLRRRRGDAPEVLTHPIPPRCPAHRPAP
ncbi:hypothetical protein [Massilia scottii]|uniref:hypothetical protein n=1 Tax=Massilia scottii TaxID=3057166 RepID=UPI002796D48A|nr:hypothetical protein [Massilia sp. CCM 9029]MDQ1835164.1 hypothetical protein [Massilia sp. CCM 9029]